ncbi:hypothetical protein DL96DRAFT_1494149 [Flagelloscypha sp. PMI_526]|nr:hypothetical protein DL96DRAFT_1494149 [Flagelloscypha sp. PMI_526]
MDNTGRTERRDAAVGSRMSRGLVACAECRRMKLKCDKKLPCGSCVRRGCSNICPTGKLPSRQETRTILAEGSSGRDPQDEIARLRERNLQLEDALAFAHSHISKEAHPLLSEASPKRPQDVPEVGKATEVLGTLAIGEAGEVKYFGPSAGTEVLYQAISATDEHPSSSTLKPDLDATLESLSPQFPFGSTLDMETLIASIITNLPVRMRAFSLCDIFYEHYTIYYVPIQREEFVQDYLLPIYQFIDAYQADQRTPFPSTSFRPHRCAVIYLAFAIATWLDMTTEQCIPFSSSSLYFAPFVYLTSSIDWVDADRYFQIGLSCLSMQSIFNSPEVASVQALMLFAAYNEFQGAISTATLDPSWTILSLACKVAQGLGLHRDSAKWNLDDVTVQRRRWLYWELVSLEMLASAFTGRPPSIRQSYVDTELPDDAGRTDARGQPLQGFFRWKHEALRDFHLDLLEILLAAIPPKYEAIIELDRKVRAKEIPNHLNRIIEDGDSFRDCMQSCLLGLLRSLLLLCIHRIYLTKALDDPSGNPFKSQYAPSFLASYRAASWIIKSLRAIQKRFPFVLARLWHPWTNVMTASMVLGSIAIKIPASIVGNSPLEELRVARAMFDEAAPHTLCHRTKNGAKIVKRILARAEEAHARRAAGDASVVPSGIAIPPTDFGDDELAIFGGQTRLLPMKSHRKAKLQRRGSTTSAPPNLPGEVRPLEDVHPSLIHFLNTAPMTQLASPATFQDPGASTLGTPLQPPFHHPGFLPPQMGSGWAQPAPPIPQNQYNFGNISGPSTSTSGLQASETFGNNMASTTLVDLGQEPWIHTPVDLGQEPSTIDPWQDFMKRSFPE